MVKKLLFFLLFLTVSLINAQDPSGLTLSEARPFCSDSGAQFPNTHNGSNSLPGPVPIVEEETMADEGFGCLFPQLRKNPTWFYMRIASSGDLNLNLTSFRYSNGADLDTDFVAWGPFTEDNFNSIISDGTGIDLTGDNLIDCQYTGSGSPLGLDGEIIYIEDASIDDYYIVLITNYAGVNGYSQLTELYPSNPDTATTDCFVNDAPTITSTAVTEATEDVAYTYEITTEDIDGDLVTVSATGLPSWLTLTDNTLSGTPTEGEAGSEITITATDDGEGALTATQTFTIVVTPVNDAPTITSTAVTEATEDVAYTYEITTEDIDGDLVTVSATGLPSWLTLTDNTLSGTPTEGEAGSEITITATDDGEGALTATQTFTIVVTPVNDAPTITSTAVTEATEDVAYTYEITTEDIDGDLVTVSATGLPSWLTLTDNTLSGTPTEGEAGSEITITATDDGEGALTATQTFTIVVTPVNDAPTITSTAVTEATEDVAYTYEITTEDIDGDLVTVSATGLPSWLTLTDNTLSGTPTEGEAGSEITITATDDGEGALTATQTFTIVVTPVNDAPTITSTAVTEATEDVAYTYEITTEDIDGDLVTVSATGLPSWLTLTDNTLSGTPTEGEAGSEITITATDDGEGALTATQTFTIVVTPVNDAPTITSTAVTEATEDVAYTYEITTEDIDGDLVTVSATGLPSWLTLTDNTLSGTPTEGEAGSEITITATDDGEGALTATQTFTIVVTPVNDAPTITSTAVTEATEDVAYTYEITTEDIDGDLVTVSATGLPSWLTLTDNTLSGTPTEGELGSEITITATDDGEGALTATQTFTIVVTPVNDAPTITSTAVTEATEDVAYTYEITTEDIDGDLVTVSATGLPSWLTLTDNTLSGTPTEGEAGSEITITATDDGEGALTATQTFTIVVTPVNDAPTITSTAVTEATEDVAYTYEITTEDIDGDLVTVSATGLPSWLTLTDNTLSGTPTEGEAGSEITITATDDGEGALTATQTFTIVVTPVNDAPTITSTAVTEATEDVAYTYEITTEDIDGDLVTVSATGLPSWLTLTDNTLSGTPTEGEAGSEITITATDDGEGALTATQTFTIVVTPVNDALVAVADIATVSEDAATTSIDVIANDTSEEEDTLTLTLVNTSGIGTVSINLDGVSVDYTPSADFNGTEVITYTVSDGTDTATGTLTVTVTPVNDAPVAIADTATVSEDTATTSIEVIANDTDVDSGDILSLTSVSTSGTGIVSINSDGFSVDYTPSANFNGTEVITYTISDGTDTATGTLTVTVTPVNDAPVAIADTATVSEDSATTSIDVIANDTDEEEDTLTLTLVNTSGIGTVSINLDGVSVDYTPSADFNGTEVITYTVSDGTDTASGTLTVTVTPVNDAPVAIADTATVSEDTATTSIEVIANDTDVDSGDILSLTSVSTSGTGIVSINSDGFSVDYTPSANFNGTEVITYTVSDGTDTATGTLTVTVTPVNDAPVAIADTATVSEDSATTSIDVIANDTDEEEDTLTLTLVNTSGIGTVSINLDGVSVDYTPSADFNGTEVITYTISDGTDTATGTLTVTVTPVNDAPIAVEDTASVLENAIMISTDVISNDIDVDGDILLLSAISYSGLGTVIVNVDELSIDYTPAPNFIGTEVINYSVTDGVLSSEGVLNINVITPEEIQITKPELNIPKFFTPNGDGINDTWNIKWNNISNYKIIEVNIYNRYGKILKKLNSFDNGWDGTYNGKLMPPNDYWVAIKLVPMNETKRIIIETSNFSLIR
jgi:gliding motility-associated-like protein